MRLRIEIAAVGNSTGDACLFVNYAYDGYFDPTRYAVQVDTEANPPYKLVPRGFQLCETLDPAFLDAIGRAMDEPVAPSTCYHGRPETPCDECKPSRHGDRRLLAPKPQVHVYTVSIRVGELSILEQHGIMSVQGLLPGDERIYGILKASSEDDAKSQFVKKINSVGFYLSQSEDFRVTKHSEVR